jgi:MarR-like DNA-binding transcriptional regulator SgrR of sgrS sRNA
MKKELTKTELNELIDRLYCTRSAVKNILHGMEYSQMERELNHLQSVMHDVQCLLEDELERMEYNEPIITTRMG